jgi:hypothetical protein
MTCASVPVGLTGAGADVTGGAAAGFGADVQAALAFKTIADAISVQAAE